MSKKRTRYSARLATDWVIPSPPVGEQVNPPDQNEIDGAPQEVLPSGEPKIDDTALLTERVSTPATVSKKCARYKKAVPPSWIAPDPEDHPADGLPLGNLPRSKQKRLPIRLAHSIDISPSCHDNSGLVPPPAPIRERFHPRQQLYEEEIPSPLDRSKHARGANQQVQINSGQTAGSPNCRLASVTPPLSVGQRSSETTDTDNSFCGRDVPARGPSLSPAYSVMWR